MNFENIGLAVAIFAVCAIVILLITQGRKAIKGIENDNVRNTLSYALKVVERVVGAINQNLVDDLKENGEFTLENAKSVKEEALKDINDILGQESRSILTKGLGDVDKFLDSAVEDEVRKQKK